ncbi:MAG: acyl-CoA dehydratase activase [Caldicoprobacterales bacterium]|jgi:predicted CoA-substrate-specific enzyme activase|nr:2-hydroxyglutaryl-CoA dehydratase [Clostridiales bacterium]
MSKLELFLGLDVGSVSINLVLLDQRYRVLEKLYLRTQGKPIAVLSEGLERLHHTMPAGSTIAGVGVTGSGRELAGAMVDADVIKNEITAHGMAVLQSIPDAQTILEIGGQDSKIILLRNGVVSDFAMNTVCAAGTGSFLDRQAARLNIPIQDFGSMALKSRSPTRIAGRCAVFAESDMIHKQQMGCSLEDIIKGLCEALVRNYLNNVGKGKEILPQIVFQGGVAANEGIRNSFEEALGHPVIVPEHYDVMGAVGAGILAHKAIQRGQATKFRGFHSIRGKFTAKSFSCSGCANLCEIVEFFSDGNIKARWGDRCGKWSAALVNNSQADILA